MSNRKFCNTVKPSLASKEFLHSDNNTSIDINGNIVEDEQKLTKEFKYGTTCHKI